MFNSDDKFTKLGSAGQIVICSNLFLGTSGGLHDCVLCTVECCVYHT